MASESLIQMLQKHFRLQEFRKGQLQILESVLAQRDTLAVMPTGGGKSLCFQFPAVYFQNLVIVISPLIALMKDQVRGLRALGIPTGCLHSQQSMDEKRDVFAQMKKPGPFVLYLSPERIQNPGFKEWIARQPLALFAIDEAHCVSQWGPDFREDYHKLALLRSLRPDVPILALTATATPQVLRDVGKQLFMPEPDKHVYGFYRPNLYYQVEVCADDEEKLGLLLSAMEKTPVGRILIYCGTRAKCEDLAEKLETKFRGVGIYHAGLTPESRKEIQEKLDRHELRIIAATNAFGMGIDYPDVRLVVHYQMPANIESFYQEMGRAGRDNQTSHCLLLYSKRDKGLQSFFIQSSTAAPDVIQRRWNSLNAMTQFAEGGECRHAGILTYFKDTERIQECGHCDVCAPNSEIRVVKTEKAVGIAFKSTKGKSKLKKSATQVTSVSGPEAEARQLLLKDWRRSYAREKDIPAFIVFSDKALIDLANKNPKNLEELRNVYGFGPNKVEVLGPLIMQELGHSP